jgi:hypothetical protein
MKRLLLCLSLALTAAAATPARADGGFRCPSGRLIDAGDHMVDVRKKCGDPDEVIQRTEKRKVKVKVRTWISRTEQEEVTEEREVEVLIDEWTYDFGSDRFVRFVAFENARVVGVTTGGYGRR